MIEDFQIDEFELNGIACQVVVKVTGDHHPDSLHDPSPTVKFTENAFRGN